MLLLPGWNRLFGIIPVRLHSRILFGSVLGVHFSFQPWLQRFETSGPCLLLESYPISKEEGRALRFFSKNIDDNIGTIHFVNSFQSRTLVNSITNTGVIKILFWPNIADDHMAVGNCHGSMGHIFMVAMSEWSFPPGNEGSSKQTKSSFKLW